jgi:hypothetical protein
MEGFREHCKELLGFINEWNLFTNLETLKLSNNVLQHGVWQLMLWRAKMTASWHSIEVDRRFRGACCLHRQAFNRPVMETVRTSTTTVTTDRCPLTSVSSF